MRRIALAAVIGVVGPSCGSGEVVAGDPTSTTTTAVTDEFDFSRGDWRELPAPPAGVSTHDTVWTGTALVAPLGTAGGAMYEHGTGEWTALPASPLGPLGGAAVEWTGREVIVAGGMRPPEHNSAPLADAAAFDPTTMTWRALPAIPFGGRGYLESVWTGDEVVLWGGVSECCPIDSVVHAPQAAALDPVTGRWRALPDLPEPWAGDDGGAITTAIDGEIRVYRDGALARLGARGWTAETDPPTPGEPEMWSTAHPAAWGGAIGDEVLVWTTGASPLTGLGFDTERRRWRRTADIDGGPAEFRSIAISNDLVVAVSNPDRETGEDGVVGVYSLSDDRWIEPPRPPADVGYFPSVTWTGEELLFIGGAEDGGGTAPSFAFRPSAKERS